MTIEYFQTTKGLRRLIYSEQLIAFATITVS